MEKKSCTEKVCKRCGWCCTNLGIEVDLKKDEEQKLRRYIFRKTGVIYLRKINKFFLAISKEEAAKLKKHSKNTGIKVEISPNKLIYDKSKDKVIVFDWYLNHEVCPFYKDKACLVYEDRPLACKKFPNIDDSYSKEVAKFVKKNKIDFSGVTYAEAVGKCRSFCRLS